MPPKVRSRVGVSVGVGKVGGRDPLRGAAEPNVRQHAEGHRALSAESDRQRLESLASEGLQVLGNRRVLGLRVQTDGLLHLRIAESKLCIVRSRGEELGVQAG